MTADAFARAYAERSGVTVEWLREHGHEARPCNCGALECEGWQMASIREARWAVANGVATDEERSWIS